MVEEKKKVMQMMVEADKDGITKKRPVENTAYQRWEKIFGEWNQMEQWRNRGQVRVIDDIRGINCQTVNNSIHENDRFIHRQTEEKDEHSQRMIKMKSFQDLRGLVNLSMKLHNQI